MSFGEWPVIAPISAIEQPASANRVTVVPRRSWKVSPVMPAFPQVFRQLVLKPAEVHGLPCALQRIFGDRRSTAAKAFWTGLAAGITTLRPVLSL
jgi:hypothetical protein